MNQEIKLTKPQEPWIGSRGRIAVIIPSTNIGVEYDCQQLRPPGVTWHFCRFYVEQPDLSSDNMFLAFIDAIRHTIRWKEKKLADLAGREICLEFQFTKADLFTFVSAVP